MKVKKIVVSFVLVLSLSSAVFAEMIFDDVTDSHLRATAIKYVKEKGVFSGYEDGSFKPETKINRAELIKVLVLAAPGISEDEIDNFFKTNYLDKSYWYTYFPDVLVGKWYAKYIAYAQSQGWIEGYSDGNFKPGQFVNFVEALKMIMESNKTVLTGDPVYDELLKELAADKWYAKYLASAYWRDVLSLYLVKNESLNDGVFFKFVPMSNPEDISLDKISFSKNANRGEIAELLYRFGVINDKQTKCFAPEMPEWTEYKDKDYNFSFKYPPGFILQVQGEGETEEIGKKLKAIFIGDLTSYFSISVFEPNDGNLSIDEYAKNRGGVSIETHDISEITIDGYAGKSFIERDKIFGNETILIKMGKYIFQIQTSRTYDCGLFQNFYATIDFGDK